MSNYLQQIQSIDDLKKLPVDALSELAEEIRSLIVSSVQINGGHLASNLGSVDFTLALHYVFDSPVDKLIFDVGHQAYTHKILTGRKDAFDRLRKDDGITGFVNASESEFDCCTMGHSSTSISIGLGFARARSLIGEDYHVVTVIGDGALTGGVALEALNDVGQSETPMLIVLNDNKMSISENVGGIAKHLARLRLSGKYESFKRTLKRGLEGIPFVGKYLSRFIESVRDHLKNVLVRNRLFEDLGIKYYGPFDGHDVKGLVEIFSKAKSYNRPAVIHLITDKGKGYQYAEENPQKYHGVSTPNTANTPYASVFGDELIKLAQSDEKIVAVTAAMTSGTGLSKFAETFPNRFFDVGIAEQHAVSLCSGLARGGLKPVFAVYSTFLQRGFDEVMTDLCIDNLPVVLAIDHAGYVDGDGVTHQGLYDIAYLSQIPNLSILAPKDGNELRDMLAYAFAQNKPIAIRYPKSFSRYYSERKPIDGTWETVRNGNDTVLLACSSKMVELAMQIPSVTVVSARFVKPLDEAYLSSLVGKNVLTLEDGVLRGGFGESVLSYLTANDIGVRSVNMFGFNDRFVTTLNERDAFAQQGLTVENINKILTNLA